MRKNLDGSTRSIGPWPDANEKLDRSDIRKPSVHVTLNGPDDGGDFGPNTPGTRTSGLQEALNFAHENCRDIFVHGGRGGLHGGKLYMDNVYMLNETLNIPWSQDFTVYGGNAIWAYRKPHGDAIVIDSQMNCRYKLGLIVSESDGAAVRIQPHSPGPDDFVLVTASRFDFSAVVSKHPQGAGIVLDSSYGPILHCTVFAEETNTRGKGVYLTGNGLKETDTSHVVPSYRTSPHSIRANTINVMYNQQQHASGDCTNLWVGDPGSDNVQHNRIHMHCYGPRGAYFDEALRKWRVPEVYEAPTDTYGARIFGQDNILSLSFQGKRSKGNDLVFEEDARNNRVQLYNLPNGFTNLARVPTNRVIPNFPVGYRLETPTFPASGSKQINRTCYSVQVIISDPGHVTEWGIMDAHGTEVRFPSGLFTGQTLLLEPGEQVRFKYNTPPVWVWKMAN